MSFISPLLKVRADHDFALDRQLALIWHALSMLQNPVHRGFANMVIH